MTGFGPRQRRVLDALYRLHVRGNKAPKTGEVAAIAWKASERPTRWMTATDRCGYMMKEYFVPRGYVREADPMQYDRHQRWILTPTGLVIAREVSQKMRERNKRWVWQ